MIKNILLTATLVVTFSANSYAGDAENILVCTKKAKEFSDVTLSEFDASYKGNILSMSTVKWANANCEVKLGDVYNLEVNGKEVIYKRFAGKDSYKLNDALEAKTQTAINQLKSRIALLEQRMGQVSANLKLPKPNHVELTQFVDDGITKSVGISP